jgi:hypothetical protein
MTASNLWNKVKTYADSAPTAGFVNVNYGKLIVTPLVVEWKEVDGVRSPVKHALKEGEELQEGQQLELSFKVMISELNPALTFEYERNVPVKNSGGQKTDWDEIVRPALEKVFGKNAWADAIEKQPYVAVEDTPNLAGRASGSGKVYGIPKVTAKFASKEECVKAHDARYHKKGDAGAEEVDPTQPSPEAIEKTVALIASVGEKKARTMLDKKPFGDFDPDILFALAMNPTTPGE